MKKVMTDYGTRLSALCCSIFGHHYIVSKKVTLHIKEYKCAHCKMQVTTDVTGNLSRLTPELQEINNTLEDIFNKRHRATNANHHHQQVA